MNKSSHLISCDREKTYGAPARRLEKEKGKKRSLDKNTQLKIPFFKKQQQQHKA